MKARAVAKYIKGSPQKARLVIDLIRGRGVNDALAMLKTSNKRAAKPIEITLRSAIANAEQKADQLNVAIDVVITGTFVAASPVAGASPAASPNATPISES